VELTPLRYFATIAREGHMTRASRRLGVTQPALSAMLKKLEGEVGATLLHRTGKGVELTEAGRVFLQHAEDALRRVDAGQRAVKQLLGLEAGSIRVGGGATATGSILPGVVSRVRASHPGLRFYVRESGSVQVAEAVLSGELDLGIVTLPVLIAESDELVRVPLVGDELRLIAPPDAPARVGAGTGRVTASARGEGTQRAPRARREREWTRGGGEVVAEGAGGAGAFRWRELVGRPVVGFEAGTAVREMIDRGAAAAGVTLEYVMELRSIEGIVQMVRAGVGVGFVSKFALRGGELGAGLTCRDGALTRRLAIVRRRDREASPATRVFEAALLEWARPQ
jgi:DNA-binding transcriptional LysR family regulator